MPKVLVDFHRCLANLEHTRSRMERLHQADFIRTRDIHVIYESLFIRGVTGFEQFCENLFFAILERTVRYRGRPISARFRGETQALRATMLQGKRDKYLSWLPFSQTEERANLYLQEGKPFTELDGGDKQLIQETVYIRNAIAHSGHHAIEAFRTNVIGEKRLGRGEKTPAGFLRSEFRDNPAQKRFQVYVARLGIIAGKMC